MHNPTYHNGAHKRSVSEWIAYQQERAAGLARIAYTFLLSGNLREATRFQGQAAEVSAAAREALLAL